MWKNDKDPIRGIAMKFMKKLLKKRTPISRVAILGMKTMLKMKNDPEKISFALKRFQVKPGMKVLDYGAGIGSYTYEVSKLVGPRGNVLAVDLLETMVSGIEKEAERRGLTNVRTQRIGHFSDVLDHGFDVILVVDVIHMMDEVKELIEYLAGRTNPGGRVLAKFDHMGENEVSNLLSSLSGLDHSRSDGNWWVIEPSGL